MALRWEYDVIELGHNIWGLSDPKQLKEQLNALGRQGWELIGFNANAASGNPLAVLKRPSN